MPQGLSTNTFTSSTWIVNSDATKGTHTTLAGALTSSSSGDTILLQTSVTENPTLKVGVTIVGYSGADLNPNVKIIGKCTLTTAGTVTLSNIMLQTNSDFALAVTGSAASNVNLRNCYLNCTNNTGISFSTSDATAKINLLNCSGDLGTTGIGIYASSSAGTINLNNCNFTNTGASVTSSTASAGAININGGTYKSVFTTSGTAAIGFFNTNADASAVNTALLTAGGSGSQLITNSFIGSGTASAISVSTTVGVYNTVLNSANAAVVTGAGTIQFAGNTQGTGAGTYQAGTNTPEIEKTGIIYATSISFDNGSNTISNYAVGTFTPTMVGTVAGVTTYTAQNGYYVRIGAMVQVQAIVSGSAATGTGTMILGALPFTIKNQTNGTAFGSVISPNAGWTWPVGATSMAVDGIINTTTANIYISGTVTAGGNLQMANAVFSFQYTLVHQI